MEQLIKFETAKLVRDKGYPVKRDELGYFYVPNEDPEKSSWSTYAEPIYTVENYLPAPTQTELHKWLRENHNLYVTVVSKFPNKHYSKLYKVNSNGSESLGLCTSYDYESYEEALEMGLIKALELI